MQIVIDIDEDYVKIINKNGASNYTEEVIKNGTPLPKGHGNLKDVGECDRKLFYQQCGGADSLITVKTAFDMILSLPTIIEADKESGDK